MAILLISNRKKQKKKKENRFRTFKNSYLMESRLWYISIVMQVTVLTD